MRNILRLGFIILLAFTACINDNKTVTITKINGNKTHIFHLNEVTDSISLKLSDLVSDIRFVRQESDPDALFGNAQYYVGNRFIITNDYGNGIFEFSENGEYLRKLVNYGRGPNEIMFPHWAVSESENVIYISDSNHSLAFQCVELNTGKFLDNIPAALQGPLINIVPISDSMLVCAPLIGANTSAGEFYVFSQSLTGKLICSIKSHKSSSSYDNGEDLLFLVGEELHYRPVDNDTIYSVSNDAIEPVWIFDLGNKPENQNFQIGKTTATIIGETKNYFLLSTFTPTTKKQVGENAFSWTGNRSNIFLDKRTNKAVLFSRIQNDYFPEDIIPFQINIQSNGILYVVYQANQFKKMAQKIKTGTGTYQIISDQIHRIDDELKDEDNPVIMIGKLK